MENITIGYLTWKKTELFEKTLKSHKDNGLFDLIPPKNRIIFIQEINDIDIELAKKYGCNYIGNEKNIGMIDSFIQLVENCKTEYFIFCENDMVLMKNTEDFNHFEVKKTLEDVIEILKENNNAQVKLSNSKKSGYLYSNANIRIKKWLLKDQSKFPHKLESLSWVENPEEFYKNIEINTIMKNYKWFCVDRFSQRWSNHIYMASTRYLKEIMVPLLIFSKNNYKRLDNLYHGIEETFYYPEKYQGIDKNIDKLIEEFNKIKIISGGGNFYHNKVIKRNKTDFYDNAYC